MNEMKAPAMITFEDAVRSAQDQTLTILTSWQQGATEAFQAWMKAIAPLLPDLNLYHELPTFMQDALGDPEAIMESSYSFMIKVLELYKDFAVEVYQASMVAPRTPMVPRFGPD